MFKKIPAWLGFCLLLPYFAFASAKTDSMLVQWKTARTKSNYKTDTANITLLNKLADDYRYNNSDSSLLFANQALYLSELNKLPVQQARSLFRVGMANYIKGSYFESLEAASRLMDVSQKLNYQIGIANAYQIRGLIYLLQDEFKDALTEFLKANTVYARIKNKGKMARMLFYTGLCYDETNHPKEAFIYLDKALKLGNELKGDNHIISMIWNRMAETYFHTKNYKKAIAYNNMVLNAAYQDKWENSFAYSGLAQSQYALGRYTEATANALKSYHLSRDLNSASDAARALKILTQCYATTGDFKQAYTYQTLMNEYNQSYLTDNKQKQINYMQLQQQRSDNLRLEKENQIHQQKSKFNNLLLTGIGILAASISIFAIFISRNNVHKTILNKKLERRNNAIALQKEEISKQNERLDQLNHTKNQLFSVISHDLRGPFASVMQTMELIREGYIDAKEQKMIFDKFHDQLTHVTALVNNLLIWANSQQQGLKSIASAVNVIDTVNETLMVSSYIASNKNITIEHHAQGVKTVFADPDHLKIIMQNLVGNAIKFTPDGGRVTISYAEDHSRHIISIKDTGIGISTEKMEKLFKVVGKEISGYGTNQELGAGIGLMLIKQFIDVNKGVLKITSKPGQGTEALVYLPKHLLGNSYQINTIETTQEPAG